MNDPITTRLDPRSVALRRTIVRTLQKARRGHVGSAFRSSKSCASSTTTCCASTREPEVADRDRCILSKGHGCLALYAILADKGFFPEDELWKILHRRRHPRRPPGRGQGAGRRGVDRRRSATACRSASGIALHLRSCGLRRRVFVVLGDGECNEGSVWEAAMCAGKHRLSNLTAIVDYNKHQSYGSTKEVQDLEPFADKWRAFGFAVREVDGHDVERRCVRHLARRCRSSRPSRRAVICHTVKGKGVTFAENNMKWHHKNKVTDAEVEALLAAIEEA